MPDLAEFLFVTCQVGAEAALKAELRRDWRDFRFAYSRPGFLTFKLPAGMMLADDFELGSVFARAYGFSLGKVTGADRDALVAATWRAAEGRTFDALHVWERDAHEPGFRGYEPAPTPLAGEIDAALRGAWPGREPPADASAPVSTPATKRGQLVLDVVAVRPDEWWLGYHRARGPQSCLPGGLRAIALPPEAVSRAYLKMAEGLAWSGLPIQAGHRAVEIGCAPGGQSQALLERGLVVMGIDPAAVDERVLAAENFTHVRKRALDVRRKEFRKIRWLFADLNVAPQYTLDTVEAIVTHPEVRIRGMLLTLKLLDWELAAEIPAYLERVRSWGYPIVRARQLQYNRQEICVVAMEAAPRKPARGGRRRRTTRQPE